MSLDRKNRSPMLLSLSKVSLSFSEQPLLRGLNVDILRGETFVIIGPSGEGKSVLLKTMAGLVVPQKGSVFLEGEELGRLSRSKRAALLRQIGMTFQQSGLFDSMTCGENLRFPLRELTDLNSVEIEEKIQNALADVGLSGIADKRVNEISGGMQKRLGIARALILSPEVVLYDEPTAGLDPITSRAISDLIVRMKEKYSMTLVVVTNDLAQAYRLADRIGFLYEGDFLQIGHKDEIRGTSNPAVRQFIDGLLEGPLTADRDQEEPRDRI